MHARTLAGLDRTVYLPTLLLFVVVVYRNPLAPSQPLVCLECCSPTGLHRSKGSRGRAKAPLRKASLVCGLPDDSRPIHDYEAAVVEELGTATMVEKKARGSKAKRDCRRSVQHVQAGGRSGPRQGERPENPN